MLVTLLTTLAGPAGVVMAGQTADLPEAQAYDLIEAGVATQPGGYVPAREEAVEEVPETAVLPGRRRGRSGAAE